MRVHLNSGSDIETPAQMSDSILSSGGVSAVIVTLCESATPIGQSLNVEGVSLINNVEYNGDGIRVWKAYGVGPGKLLKLENPPLSELPSLTSTQTHSSTFTSVKARRKNVQPQVHEDQVDQEANAEFVEKI